MKSKTNVDASVLLCLHHSQTFCSRSCVPRPSAICAMYADLWWPCRERDWASTSSAVERYNELHERTSVNVLFSSSLGLDDRDIAL